MFVVSVLSAACFKQNFKEQQVFCALVWFHHLQPEPAARLADENNFLDLYNELGALSPTVKECE